MEIVDELTTPGCPQCAIKHLSAALYYMATRPDRNEGSAGREPVPEEDELLATAYINLGEVLVGYRSHLWFAVGALQRAEEIGMRKATEHPGARESAEAARAARLALERDGESAVRLAMQHIWDIYLSPAAMEAAHMSEAFRELPSFPWGAFLLGSPTSVMEAIERIREEFFVSDEAPAASTEDAEKGGESEMAKAAKKAPAFLKKGDGKAAQAACKGGKCKGKKCK
jgi:hypothetical protein